MLNAFQRAYPDFNIDNSEHTAGVFDDRTLDMPKLAAAVAAGEQPDVFYTWVTPIVGYYTDMFMPIQTYLDKDPDFSVEDCDDTTFKITTFNDLIYFMPYYYTSQIFIYNETMFQSVGLNPENPPKTWSEYLEYAQKLTTYNTDGSLKTIGAYGEHFKWDYWHIAATGDQYCDEQGLNCDWNKKSYVEIMELNRKIQDIYGGNEKLGDGWWWFVFGNVGMSDFGAADMGQFLGGTSFDINLAQIPLPDDATEYHSGSFVDSSLGIPRTAKNPTGAWTFIKYATTEGRIESEIENYQDNPNQYISAYIFHKPTREKLYDILTPIITEKNMAFLKLRDQLMEDCDVAYHKPAYINDLHPYFEEYYEKMRNHEMAPQDMVIELQKISDQLRDKFISDKEAEGWIFEDGKDGIPPSMQN